MIQSKEYLKSVFSAGNNPTTEDYRDLIDSLYGSVEMIKASIDTIDWEVDEYTPTAKAIFDKFGDTIAAIQEIIVRTEAVEQRIDEFEARIKEYANVDWTSDNDIPTANAVRQYVDEYINTVLLQETDGCLYV